MRRKVDPEDLGELERKPASSGSEGMEIWLLSVWGKRGGGDVAQTGGPGS